MLRGTRTATLVIVALLAAPALFAQPEYHDYFVGFSSELAVTSDLAVRPFFPDSLTVRSFSFAGTYGPAAIRPVRFRAGLGWFPRQPFRAFAGVELPVYEILNRARARAFGVYLLGDLGVTIPLGWTADASLAILVPTNAFGGIRLAVGIDRESNLLVTIGTATGAYPIRSRR